MSGEDIGPPQGMKDSEDNTRSNPANDMTDPEIWLELDSSSEEANVDPNDPEGNGIVMFSGEVHCDMPENTPAIERCTVSLYAHGDGLPTTTPHPMQFNSNHEVQTFTITIQVRPKTPSSVTHTIIIGGTWEYQVSSGSGTIEEIRATITVKPYGLLELKCSKKNITAGIDKWRDASLGVSNKGNCGTDVTLSFVSAGKNVEVEFSETQFSLDENGKIDVIVRIRQSGGEPGECDVTITATGSVPSGKDNPSYTLTLKTEETGLKSLIKTQYLVVLIILIILGIFLFFVWRSNGRKK